MQIKSVFGWVYASLTVVGVVLFSSLAAAQPEARQLTDNSTAAGYNAAVEIYRDGKLVAKPNIVLPNGKMARFEVGNKSKADDGIRVDLTVTDAGRSKKNQSQVRIRAVVHEKVGGAWVLLSEPILIGSTQKQNSMSVGSPLGTLELKYLVTPKAISSALIGEPKNCSSPNKQVLDTSTTELRQVCCSASCSDGSGRTLTCCENSVSCCDGVCGACCSTD